MYMNWRYIVHGLLAAFSWRGSAVLSVNVLGFCEAFAVVIIVAKGVSHVVHEF